MPRAKKQGGTRQGVQGKAHPNRTDLNAGPRLPVQTVPGQTFGDQAAQERSQQAIPMRPPPTPRPPGLGAPTQRPGEPITAGVATGPGPGPEALMSVTGPDPDAVRMARYLSALQPLADHFGDVSPDLRQLVRRLRAAQPPNGAE